MKIAQPFFLIAALTAGCIFPSKDNPATCRSNSECAPKVCNLATYLCEPAGGTPDSSAGGSAGTGGVVAGGSGGTDDGGSIIADVAGGAGGNDLGGSGADASPDIAVGSDAVDSAEDRAYVDAAVDQQVPDAPGTCSVDKECGALLPLCLGRVCAKCASDLDCAGRVGTPACDATSGLCVACVTSKHCSGTTPACDTANAKCVGCMAASDCTSDPSKSFCVSKQCAGCQTAGATACAGARPVCATAGTAIGQCVECAGDGQCTGVPGKGFCVSNVCTGCTTPGATGCVSRTDGKTVCATTGTAAGQCVECVDNSSCIKDAAKEFCVNNACTGCQNAGSAACTGSTPLCAATGNNAGKCVECLDNNGCTKDAAKGFCVNNACTGCQNAGATACISPKAACATTGTLAGQCVECVDNTLCTSTAAKHFCVSNACAGCDRVATNPCSGATPVCAPSATPTVGGQCVGCLLNSDCASANPICATNKCRTCKKDSECVGISNAGVCDLNGACPGDNAVIYLQNNAACSPTNPGNGSASTPFCFSDDAVGALLPNKSLIVVKGPASVNPQGSALTLSFAGSPVLIAGQSLAKLGNPQAGTPPLISITAGEVTLRDLTISAGNGVGVSVTNGATLHMARCYVLNNQGLGIQTTASAFDIANTVVAGNGGGSASYGVLLGSYSGTGPAKFAFNTVVNNSFGGVACGSNYSLAGILANANGPANFLSCVTDTTTSTAAPNLVSSTNYHLTATSPCVNAGGDICPPDDIDGDARPQGAHCDCGADEYKP